LGETAVNIVWTTNNDAISWVELAPDDGSHFYLYERPKHFAVEHGLKNISKIHNVKLDGLKPGTKYRYRAYSQEVKSHVSYKIQYGNVAATAVYRQDPLTFETLSKSKQNISFAVINDIHGRNEVMSNLLGQLDWDQTDLVFFNGDMADNLRSEEQMFTDYLDTGIKMFAGETPMYYARGNHETRGEFASEIPKYYPSNSGKLYYMFQQGPICFIVLDGGEDKPDSDIEYSGIAKFDDYRTKQAEWLKQALESPEYKDAIYKVVISHIPTFGGWHGARDYAEKFNPLLNKAKAQVMISGHLHRHVKKDPEAGAHDFPILVNSNSAMVKATADSKSLQIDVLDQSGKVLDSITLQPQK
jgi:predicted phosphodiesterase